MPRVVGVDIPNEKVAWVALQYIHGVGKHTALAICEKLHIDPQRRAKDLTDEELAKVGALVEQSYVVEGNLRRQTQQNISRLKEINCYRGIRHRRGLPVRGQRTKTNGRTRKGPAKTVGRGKKAK